MMEDKELSNLISGRLRGLCSKQGISLSCVAKRSGVSLSTVYRLASGNSGNVRIETIGRLCTVLAGNLKVFWINE